MTVYGLGLGFMESLLRVTNQQNVCYYTSPILKINQFMEKKIRRLEIAPATLQVISGGAAQKITSFCLNGTIKYILH